MMALRLVHRPDGAASVPDTCPIASAGSTIGRAPECDFVLDDPVRLVSRRHAWLVPRGDDTALLKCISTSASMLVNGAALPPGGECLVHSGDRLRIGVFELVLEHGDPDFSLPTTRPNLAAVVAVARPPVPASAPIAAAPVLAAQMLRPRLDRWFDLDGVADPLGPGSPLPGAGAGSDDEATVALRRDPPTRTPARVAPVAPPVQPVPSAAAVAPVIAPIGSAAPVSPELETLRQAFIRGAGLGPATPLVLSPAMLEHLGALLKAMTEGTLELLRGRAMAKRSIRAEGTHMVARENNPLKFAPDAVQALTLLLTLQGRPGFLDPLAALHDAHDDLQVHQLAMAAGMRAAVFDLVSRLGPDAVESEEGPADALARYFPVLRDAALWRRYGRSHARLLEHFDDTLESTFGREFLLAYEAQAKLAAATAPGELTPPGSDFRF